MANPDAPYGFYPVRHVNGDPYNGPTDVYQVAASYGTALYIGQPVIVTGEASSTGIPVVSAVTIGASNPATAVIMGFEALPTSLETKHWPASTATARKVYCVNVRDYIFKIREDSVGGALTAASTGLNASWVGTTGNNTTGVSKIYLDSNTANTTNTLQLRILRLAPEIGNEIGNYAQWWVKFLYPQDDALLGI